MINITTNTEFNLLCQNLAKKIHEKSSGKLSIKKTFLESCLAESLPGVHEGFNINSLKRMFKENGVTAQKENSSINLETVFNDRVVSEMISIFLNGTINDLFIDAVIGAIKDENEGESIFDVVNENGEINEIVFETFQGTESFDPSLRSIYDSMSGTTLSEYIDSQAENLPSVSGKSFTERKLEVHRLAFGEFVLDSFCDCLRELSDASDSRAKDNHAYNELSEIVLSNSFSVQSDRVKINKIICSTLKETYMPVSFSFE